jgi:Tol biopolymer transport system component/tRNA A-37 threonylcarbamoyl transferase component Bud32
MTGRTLSHYEILEPLGEGGMGTVYKARDTRLNRIVAIKSLRGASPDRKTRFVQEAQAASALNHPNIVTIHELLADSGEDFIVMEFISGRTLDRVIPRNGLRIDEILKLAIPAASALTAAHQAGIVHRDIKPANIMVRDDGVAKILDFGLAKLTESTPLEPGEATLTMHADTEEGTVLGTVSYMSPEQAEGHKVDARSDIFSFGSVLYEMATGHRAFSGSSKLSTLSAILKEDPKPPSGLGIEIPRELERIISRCLRKDIDRRFQLMKEVRNALQELKEDSESGRLTVAAPAAPAGKSNRILFLGLAAGLVLAAAGGVWWRSLQKPVIAELTLRQVTQDDAFSSNPALSSDGRLLAYASTRAGSGRLDIWLQPLAQGAQPLRLTSHPAEDFNPGFSPDGGQIVFCSTREGGGVYLVPAFGGEERLLLRGNYWKAAFSPDGKLIAAFRDADTGRTFVVPANGGEPRQIAADFYDAKFMAWSPDGRYLLLSATRKQGYVNSDWWLAGVGGEPPIPLHADSVIPRTPQGALPRVSSWSGEYLFYSTRNLQRLRFDMSARKLLGPSEAITRGASSEFGPVAVPFSSPSGWRIAFASMGAAHARLVSVAVDSNTGKVTGNPEIPFQDGSARFTPTASTDGNMLAYVLANADGFGIRVFDRKSGDERTVYTQRAEMRPRISPDGATIAYNPTGSSESDSEVFLIPSSGGSPRKVCGNCGLLQAWTPDGKRLIYRSGNPMRYSTFDIATGQSTEIVAHPKHHVHAATYSPDQRWLALHLAPGDGPSHIFITPVRDGKGAPESEWIPVFTKPGYNSRPWWSADGNLLYFSSDALGSRSFWAQRLDRATGKPLGQPWIVYTPSNSSETIQTNHRVGVAFAANRLIFGVSDLRSNIWLAE